MDNKTALRINAKNIRKSLDIAQLSEIAVSQIRGFGPYIQAKNVMLFYPMKYELNLLKLLDDNKNFYLPKVCGEELKICPFTLGDKLVKSKFNVCEPCTDSINPEGLDLIIVPGLMADKNNYRLGYGGGFYDRFLASYNKIPTILPIAKDLMVESLPCDEFDIKVDFVLIC